MYREKLNYRYVTYKSTASMHPSLDISLQKSKPLGHSCHVLELMLPILFLVDMKIVLNFYSFVVPENNWQA
jgi:hypothetical protein